MTKSNRVLRTSIATLTAVVLTVPALRAATLDSFTTGDPTRTPATPTILRLGAGPTVTTETTPIGDITFLRMLEGINDENNLYSYNMSDAGAFETTLLSVDFRVLTGSNGLADGMGLLLLPTSVYGTEGPGPTPTAEEPNVVGAFGLGIDVYPGINNISTHWNGFQVGEMNPAPNVSFRDNTYFNRVEVQLQRVGNATNATVTITPDILGFSGAPGTPYKIMETVIPNMLPYENRLQLGARTGGENMKMDVDNVKVQYSNAFTAVLPDAPVGHLFQDFDSAGTTSYRAVQQAQTDATTFRPGPLIKASEAGADGAFMRVVNDAVAGQNNRIVFDRAFDAGASTMGEVLEFQLRFNSTDQPADGLGLLFLPTTNPATGVTERSGDGIASSEEPNHPGMLGIGFDVYPNGGADVAPGMSLHFNNTKLADVPLPAEFALGQFHKVQVVREVVEGGLSVTVKAFPDINGAALAPVTLLDKQFVPGATNYDYRVQFSGRTGGANGDHDIDEILSYQLAAPAAATTRASFTSAGEAPWKAYSYGAGAPSQVRTDAIPGPEGQHLRLIHDANNSQLNSLVFDKQVDGSIAGKTGITGDFDVRMSGANAPADGFSLMLIPTATYGNTGPGAAGNGGFVAEEPNVTGVFAIGVDLYNGGTEFNEISAHWDGLVVPDGERQLIDALATDLDTNLFHHIHFELRQSGADTLLDLVLTPNDFGSPGTPRLVFDDLVIPGMSLYDYRVEFAGRTGGADMSVDLDNILIQSVPEPGSAALLALGGVVISSFRRRRADRR